MIAADAWKIPVLAFFGIVGLLLAGWKPRAGVYVLIALSPAQFVFFPVGSFFLSPADMLVSAGALGFAVRALVVSPTAWGALWGHRWLIGMVLGYVVGSLILGIGPRTLVRIPLAMAPSLLILAYLTTERSIRAAQVCLIVAGALDAVYGAAALAFGVPSAARRFAALAGSNFDATIILLAATAAWALWAGVHRLAGAAVLTVLGMATLSRGGMLAFIGALSVAVAPVLRRRARWLLAGAVLVLSAIAFSTDIGPEIIEARLEQSPTSLTLRELVVRAALQAFLAQPVTGTGFGGFFLYSAEDPEIAARSGNEGTYTHNTPLEILSEGGLLAFVPFGLYCWGIMRPARRMLDRAWRLRDRVAAASLGLFVEAVVASQFANTLLLYYTWIACGILMAHGRVSEAAVSSVEPAPERAAVAANS